MSVEKTLLYETQTATKKEPVEYYGKLERLRGSFKNVRRGPQSIKVTF